MLSQKTKESDFIGGDPAVYPQKKSGRNFWTSSFTALCWVYLILLVALVLTLRTLGDRFVLPTLLLFSPRWPWLLPLILFFPPALLRIRKTVPVVLAAAVVGVFPLMNYAIGWHRFLPTATGKPIRVLAFNVHHSDLFGPAVATFMTAEHPDVVTLEEIPPQFNRGLFPVPRWQVVERGELCLASVYPVKSVKEIVGSAVMVCDLDTPAGPVQVVVTHLSSPHYALRDSVQGAPDGDAELSLNIASRDHESADLEALAGRAQRPLIIAGDFNLTPDSRLFRRSLANMTDSFDATEFGFGWTYENKWTAVRIDHVLSNHFFGQTGFKIGPDLGSPHRPIVADLMLKPR